MFIYKQLKSILNIKFTFFDNFTIIYIILGTILNATVQSYLRSTEITNPGTVTLSEEKIDSVDENYSEETAELFALTPDDKITVLDANKSMEEMTNPGGAESSRRIPREDKKRSKLKSFLTLPKFLQKAFKGIRNLLVFVNVSNNYMHSKNYM